MKKVLVLGGTGAMGRYAVPELIKMGFQVETVSRRAPDFAYENVKVITADAMDDEWLKEQLAKMEYDVILDFMIYHLPQFKNRVDLFLENTKQYMFLSSCRVYANKEIPVRETSPRLLDVSEDREYLGFYETEYSLHKAAAEDILINSGKKNWTIILPATTYSTGRAQLVTLEADTFVYRALTGKPVAIPIQAKDKPATLSWGGDVGVMIARLAGMKEALGEKYIVASAEHNTWGEIAEVYHELIGLEYEWVDKEDYLRILSGEKISPYARYQLEYARMFDRITDNSKILRTVNMKQEDLMSFYDGMKLELSRITADDIKPNIAVNHRMDEFFEKKRKTSDR